VDTRASDDERQASVEALTTHVQSGRLNLGEFEQRVQVANEAEFRAQLAALFSDLPDPHPRFDDAAQPGTDVAARHDADVAVRNNPSGLLRTAAYSLFPLSGVIAVVLLIATGWWLWLLIIPPAAYLAREMAKRSGRRKLGN
jgi:hypothetical protein